CRPDRKQRKSRFDEPLIRAVVRVLRFDSEIFAAQKSDYLLKCIPVLSADANYVALDTRLDLEFAVFDGFDDLFGLLRWQALLRSRSAYVGSVRVSMTRSVSSSIKAGMAASSASVTAARMLFRSQPPVNSLATADRPSQARELSCSTAAKRVEASKGFLR